VNTEEIEEINKVLSQYDAYLWVEAELVEIDNDIYTISFILWNILFLSDFNVTNNVLFNLKILSYWEDIAIPEDWLVLPDKFISVDDFELSLIRREQYKINQFKINPIEYIKSIKNERHTNRHIR
jgi:hypothetical protein